MVFNEFWLFFSCIVLQIPSGLSTWSHLRSWFQSPLPGITSVTGLAMKRTIGDDWYRLYFGENLNPNFFLENSSSRIPAFLYILYSNNFLKAVNKFEERGSITTFFLRHLIRAKIEIVLPWQQHRICIILPQGRAKRARRTAVRADHLLLWCLITQPWAGLLDRQQHASWNSIRLWQISR